MGAGIALGQWDAVLATVMTLSADRIGFYAGDPVVEVSLGTDTSVAEQKPEVIRSFAGETSAVVDACEA